MIGSSARRSTMTNAAAASTSPAPNAHVSGESQPSSFLPPKSVKKIRHVVAAESSSTPRMSIRFSAFLFGRVRVNQAMVNAAMPIGDVDVEGPFPGQVVHEETAQQGPGDGGEAEDGAQRAHVLAALLGRDDVGDDGLRQDHQAAAAEALDGAEDHEAPEVGGEGAADGGER